LIKFGQIQNLYIELCHPKNFGWTNLANLDHQDVKKFKTIHLLCVSKNIRCKLRLCKVARPYDSYLWSRITGPNL